MVEGELRSYERVHAAVRGAELVFHQGALPLRPALRPGPADDERRQRRGDAQRPARRAGRRGAARRVRVVVVRLRKPGDAAARRDGASRPDRALRRRQARGRALLRQLQPRLPDRGRVAPLLQRLRAEAGSELGVRGRRAPLHHRGRGRAAGARLRRRRAAARLHLRPERPRRVPRRRGGAGRRRSGLQHRHRPLGERERARGRGRRRRSGVEVEREHRPARAGDIRSSWADISEARAALGWEPQVGLEEGLRATVESLGVT